MARQEDPCHAPSKSLFIRLAFFCFVARAAGLDTGLLLAAAVAHAESVIVTTPAAPGTGAAPIVVQPGAGPTIIRPPPLEQQAIEHQYRAEAARDDATRDAADAPAAQPRVTVIQPQ